MPPTKARVVVCGTRTPPENSMPGEEEREEGVEEVEVGDDDEKRARPVADAAASDGGDFDASRSSLAASAEQARLAVDESMVSAGSVRESSEETR